MTFMMELLTSGLRLWKVNKTKGVQNETFIVIKFIVSPDIEWL